jgi:propanol-preferring alcohol dehydrogenase
MAERTMRAARFHGAPGGLRLETLPWPVAGPGEAVVRVAACGICGSDVHLFEDMPAPAPLPLTLGHEAAGVVESVGAGVDGVRPGDRVAISLGLGCGACRACASDHPMACTGYRVPGLHYDGAFADAVRVPAGSLVPVPAGVSLAAAAIATDCVATPWHALRCRGGLAEGERVAVFGAGGLGVVAVPLAKLLGASQVISVDVAASALARAVKFGADETVRVEADRDAASDVREHTGGGADLVVECVGRPETTAAALRCLRPGGRLVLVGVCMQPPRLDLPQALFCIGELTVLGSFASHRADLEAVLALAAEGRLDLDGAISHRLPLDRVAEGIEMLHTRRGDPQRIVVEPGA